MNRRQTDILQLFLVSPGKTFRVHELADTFHISEKTIRNEFKEIDKWLHDHTSALLIRRRSQGVYLDISEAERQRLLHVVANLSDNQFEQSDKSRLFDILKIIIDDNKKITIQALSKRYFVSQNVIRKDLETIENLLHQSGLTLETKQNVGVTIEGDELNRREVLLKLLEFISEDSFPGRDDIKQLFDFQEYAVAELAVRELNDRLPYTLTDAAFKNLIVHILIAVHRIKTKNAISFPQSQLADLQSRSEYALLSAVIKPLEKAFSVTFSEHESAYLALRIIGSKVQTQSATSEPKALISETVMAYTQALTKHIAGHSNTDFHNDDSLINGLNLHFQVTFQRLEYDLRISNPMVNDIKKMYPYMFQLVYSAVVELEDEYGIHLPEDEMAYIALHFQSALERLNKFKGHNKRALIVCTMGIGMSQLLETKLEHHFDFLKITGCISAEAFKAKKSFDNIDFVITTVPLNTEVPYVEISPLLFDHDQQKIESFVRHLDKTAQYSHLKQCIEPDFIFLNAEAETPDELIKQLTKSLWEKGKVNKAYTKSALKREKTSSTAIGGSIAIPHGDPALVIDPVIAAATLKKPVQWGNEKVTLVFLLANTFTGGHTTKKLFRDLSLLSENPETVKQICKQQTKDDFLSFF